MKLTRYLKQITPTTHKKSSNKFTICHRPSKVFKKDFSFLLKWSISTQKLTMKHNKLFSTFKNLNFKKYYKKICSSVFLKMKYKKYSKIMANTFQVQINMSCLFKSIRSI